ncbi:MAG: D-glycerate 3-kinase [Lentisphaeria bacterium]
MASCRITEGWSIFIESKIVQTIDELRLPKDFISTVSKWYAPVAEDVAFLAHMQANAMVIGVQGCQGSGKSTLSHFLKVMLGEQHGLSAAVLSIDDFYLTKPQRKILARDVHSLLSTRGVPGTHDVALALSVISSLSELQEGEVCLVPRFDKAADDRVPKEQWSAVSGAVDVIILEGWCVGLTAQEEGELFSAVNELERQQDSDLVWRQYVNKLLRGEYSKLFESLDYLLMIHVPSFTCVYQWRLLQEQKLIESLEQTNKSASSSLQSAVNQTMSPEQLCHFISHYQRLTEHALKTLPGRADWLLTMDEHHRFTGLERRLTKLKKDVGNG